MTSYTWLLYRHIWNVILCLHRRFWQFVAKFNPHGHFFPSLNSFTLLAWSTPSVSFRSQYAGWVLDVAVVALKRVVLDYYPAPLLCWYWAGCAIEDLVFLLKGSSAVGPIQYSVFKMKWERLATYLNLSVAGSFMVSLLFNIEWYKVWTWVHFLHEALSS